MPRAQVRVRAEFCAAFRLAMEGASDRENAEAFGVCFSPHFHGHNYLLEVAVSGDIDPRTGLGVTDRRVACVRARRGVDTDPLATAGLVLDEDRWRAALARLPSAEGYVATTAR